MAISMKTAKRIQKRCLKVGIYECALEEGVSEDTINRYLRLAEGSVQKEDTFIKNEQPEEVNDNRPVLIVPDLHAPYHHPDTIEFLKWVQEVRGCRERIASVGDMWDFHSMSFHKSEPESMSPEDEYLRIKDFSAEFSESFPCGDVVLGNHCDIPKRKMVDAGLAPSMLKTPNKLYNLPDTWTIHPLYYVLEPDTWDVLVEHGCGSGGKYGCANTSKEKRCSYVQGHTHSNAAVIYSQNYKNTTFGMNVGCLIDSSSYAFKYSKHTIRKGNIGCGVVYNGSHAEFIPMSTWEAQR
tara:strand:- start:1798 stop:2682 length:885 start_codon:yes stop_codon:yes gene_type:complete